MKADKRFRRVHSLKMLKQMVKKQIASSQYLNRFLGTVTGKYPRVFIYHRFASSGTTHPHTMPADIFRRQLEILSANFQVLSLAECTAYFNKKGSWPKNTAAITVDDGYRDFYQWAYPELKRLSLPATFYITVNFVDKKALLWHDRLHHAIKTTSEPYLQITLGNKTKKFPLDTAHHKFSAWKALSDFCIASKDHDKMKIIALVESLLGIIPPIVAPADYAPVNWDELRQMSNNGIEIGSHTLNHPILSKIPPDRLYDEIVVSKQILEEKLNTRVHTFSYPNGMPSDINDTVVSAVRNAGYTGAPACANLTSRDPFRIPRMGSSHDLVDFISKLNGIEHIGYMARKISSKGAFTRKMKSIFPDSREAV